MIANPAALSISGQTRTECAREQAFGGGVLLNDLLVASGQHEEAALAQFYELTSPWIYYLLLRRTESTALAENALRDVYVAVWHQAATFVPSQKSALAWATTIALGLVQS